MQGRTVELRFALLLFTAALIVLAFAAWQWPSIRTRYPESSNSSRRNACEPIRIDGATVGTYCVNAAEDPGHSIVNRISLDNDFLIRSDWEVKTAYLWMGPQEVQHMPPNFEAVPYEAESYQQSTVLRFADVSIAGHLSFDCSRPSATYISKAVAFVGKEGSQNVTKLEAEVAFDLKCIEAEREGSNNASIVLLPADNPNKLIRASVENQPTTSQQYHRDLWSLLPQVDYECGIPSLKWLTNVKRNARCASTPLPDVRGVSQLLNEEFLRKAYITNYLAGNVCYERKLIKNLDKFQEVYEHFHAWDDGADDVSVIAKIEGTCYAAFRATDPFNLRDGVFQNLDCCAQQIPYTNCYIRDGMYAGYFTNYAAEFEEKLDACLDSCEGGPCELIFTGGSQGAGPATVASIVYEDYNPKVITWGGARAIYRISPDDNTVCQHVNPQNHFRMVLTDKMGLIDFIPYQWAYFAEHVGHEILYDSDSFNYMGINNRVQRSALRYQIAVHAPCNYERKTRQLFENVCFPAASYGWVDGHWCAVDDDCESRLCYEGNCFAGREVGETCDRDQVCKTKVCNPNLNRCAPEGGKMEDGSQCVVDDDCASGRCDPTSWLPFMRDTCQQQLETGEQCNEDSDCKSGYCGGFLWRRRCWPDDHREGG